MNRQNSSKQQDDVTNTALVPVIQGTFYEIEPNINSIYNSYAASPDIFNKETHFPMSFEQQLVRIEEWPKEDDLIPSWDGKFRYLPIEYILGRLSEIFGPDNYRQICKYDVPQELYRDAEGIVYVDFSVLVVRWANSDVVTYKGFGESKFQFKNLRVPSSLSNSWKTAQSESMKSCARTIGKIFGKGLKEAEQAGLLAPGSANSDPIISAMGTRLIPGIMLDVPDSQKDREFVATMLGLQMLAKKFTGESLEGMSAKGKKVLADLLTSLPTIQQKATLLQDAAGYGQYFDWEVTSAVIQQWITNKRKQEAQDVVI